MKHNNCPCDLCITRAVCLCKTYQEMMECPFVREFLNADSGNITIPELKKFCVSMRLMLVESHRSSTGPVGYFIRNRRRNGFSSVNRKD